MTGELDYLIINIGSLFSAQLRTARHFSCDDDSIVIENILDEVKIFECIGRLIVFHEVGENDAGILTPSTFEHDVIICLFAKSELYLVNFLLVVEYHDHIFYEFTVVVSKTERHRHTTTDNLVAQL